MRSFIRTIKISNQFNPEFWFEQIQMQRNIGYFVTVKDQEGKEYAFNMKLKDEKWKIVNAPKVPEWIITVEDRLEQAILDSF